MGNQHKGLSRREFIVSSSVAAGATGFVTPLGGLASVLSSPILKDSSALQTRMGLKFVVNGIIHEAAWEGPCRWGQLEHLTHEAEKRQLEQSLAYFKKQVASHAFHPAVELLPLTTTHLFVEKGNPDIMLPAAQLDQLRGDDPQTDVYVVVGGGIPQYTALRIAETFKKPVILMQPAGWATDAPAGIRARGLEGYYAQDWEQLDQFVRVLFVRKAVQHTRMLSVTNFPNRPPRGVISCITDFESLKSRYSIGYENVNYDRFFKLMDEVVRDEAVLREADRITDKLLTQATESDMTREDVQKSVLFYLAAKKTMDRYDCNAFLIECFELCSSTIPWNRRFTPCLTNALLKDSGYPAACEHDVNALLAMMMEMYLSRKAVYMGNPDIDLKNNTLSLHHSVASLKMLGLDAPDTPYSIRPFTVSGFGVTLRHDFNREIGQAVTLARFDPSGTKLLVTTGSILSGEDPKSCGCVQKVTLSVGNARDLLRAQQDFGHHLAMVFGDYVDDLVLLGEAMGFEVVVV